MSRAVEYDAVAATYDRRYVQNDYSGVERALIRFIGNEPGLSVLEVGCGTGHWLQRLSSRDLSLAGLDDSASMLNSACIQAPTASVVRGDAARLPFASHSLDRVFCINAFHHFSDQVAFLAEARRVLRRNGSLMIVGLDPHTGLDRWYVYDYFEGTLETDKRRYPSAMQLRDWMTQLGYVACATCEIQHIPIRMPAEEALAQGRLEKTATSQLSVLSDEEYKKGIERIRQALATAARCGDRLNLMANLRLYATTGTADH
jgi:ubiquinone/menaquinone biosynthesis C-methylase UbiE